MGVLVHNIDKIIYVALNASQVTVFFNDDYKIKTGSPPPRG